MIPTKHTEFKVPKCNHKGFLEVKREKDEKMLCGYSEIKKCKKCGCAIFHTRVEIMLILQWIARDLKVKPEELTAQMLSLYSKHGTPVIESGKLIYVTMIKPPMNKQQAQLLLNNPTKYL